MSHFLMIFIRRKQILIKSNAECLVNVTGNVSPVHYFGSCLQDLVEKLLGDGLMVQPLPMVTE